ncbi:hypothetical protein [Spiroplasma kunkelii]|uniref:hypothetical protein n=1 Tax=Spiroplasma kunkelii TaxID=47834 RepID=UPI0003237676|nr:hypothetical protein [Spiroplasma kunkelii]
MFGKDRSVVYIQTIKAHFVTKKLINIVSNKATVIRDSKGYIDINYENMFELIKKSEDFVSWQNKIR